MPRRLAGAVLRWLPAKSVLPVSRERKTPAMIGWPLAPVSPGLCHQRPDSGPAAENTRNVRDLITQGRAKLACRLPDVIIGG
jgi:hypothetical protein